jgi:hypothetical protein
MGVHSDFVSKEKKKMFGKKYIFKNDASIRDQPYDSRPRIHNEPQTNACPSKRKTAPESKAKTSITTKNKRI